MDTELPEVNKTGGSHPLLAAAREADPGKLRKLLNDKKVEKHTGIYKDPNDWVYTYEDLKTATDSDGRTCLHLSAAIGDPKLSLECVQAILKSFQLLGPPNSSEKFREFTNLRDKRGEIALHLAIDKRAADVVAYLLEAGANIMARNRKKVEAIRIIYEKLPDAMTRLYNRAIEFHRDPDGHSDYQTLSIQWGAVMFFFEDNPPLRSKDSMTVAEKLLPCHANPPECESRTLRYVLNADRWGAKILCHPLIKLYLEEKWKRIQWFFWLTFILEMVWLFTYATAFVTLHLSRKHQNATESHNCGASDETCDSSGADYPVAAWTLVGLFSLVTLVKEILHMLALGWNYFNLERITRILFVKLVLLLCFLLMIGKEDAVASLSVVGVILSTMLIIFLWGKTPCLGHQVAAWKKVMYSFVPHVLVFIAWFTGFGLIFWAILYEAETSWIVGMVALMAAMGTGELNAKDYIEDSMKDKDGSALLGQIVLALAILFFVILIVTLYFNLLIGYAVSDIQVLKQKAEALQLSNKLNTIYTIESFLVSWMGRILLRFKWIIERCITPNGPKQDPTDSIFIIPHADYKSSKGVAPLELNKIPHKLANELVKLAYENKERVEQENQQRRARMKKLISATPTESDPTQILHNLSATITSDGQTIRVQFDPIQLAILKQGNGQFELKPKS